MTKIFNKKYGVSQKLILKKGSFFVLEANHWKIADKVKKKEDHKILSSSMPSILKLYGVYAMTNKERNFDKYEKL